MAFRNVFQQAKPGLLEPIVKIEITVPGSKVGDITSDMSGRRGRVLRMDSAGGDMQTVIAEVPLAEVMTYARGLSSITGGRAATRWNTATTTSCPATCSRTSSPSADEGGGRGVAYFISSNSNTVRAIPWGSRMMAAANQRSRALPMQSNTSPLAFHGDSAPRRAADSSTSSRDHPW